MKIVLQSVANAEALEASQASGGHTLATSIRTDELGLGTRLASLADSYGISVKTDLPAAANDNSLFAQAQVGSLTQLIAICEEEKQSGTAAQLRTFAAEAIPTLQKDLDQAKAAK